MFSKCFGGNELNIPSNHGSGLDSFRTPVKPVLGNGNELSGSFQSTTTRPEFTRSSCSGNLTASRVELSDSASVHLCAREMIKVDENGKTDDQFKTPIRQVKCPESSLSVDLGGSITRLTNGVSTDYGTVAGSPKRPSTHHDIIKSIKGGPIGSSSTLTVRDGPTMNSYNSPVRQEGYSSLSESFDILDEEFYESILQEIDALCENKPKVISSTDNMVGNVQTKSQSTEINGGDCKTIAGPIHLVESLETEKLLDCADVQDCVEDGSAISETSITGCMPKAYAKYIQSLNDKQREAACSDISIPLVIVAGPGSGKVCSLFLSFPCDFLVSILYNCNVFSGFNFQTSTMVGRVLMLLNEVVL